jgi:hypothetical protein
MFTMKIAIYLSGDKKIYAWAPTEPTGGTPSWSSTLAAWKNWENHEKPWVLEWEHIALFLELKLS